MLFGAALLLLGALLVGGFLLGSRGSGLSSSLTFSRFLFFLGLLRLLGDLDDLDLGQVERAAAVRPALLVFHHFDPLAACQHVAGPLKRVLAAEAFVDRHGSSPCGVSFPMRPKQE